MLAKFASQTDHPAIGRTLLHEAQQAHFYGLADNIALASVITTPAKVMGLDWRIGFIRDGALLCVTYRVSSLILAQATMLVDDHFVTRTYYH